MNLRTNLIYVGIFILSFVVGFAAFKLVSKLSGGDSGSGEGYYNESAVQIPESTPRIPHAATAPVIASVDGPDFVVLKRYYTATVNVTVSTTDSLVLSYELYDSEYNLISSGTDPVLILPQTPSATYYVKVVNTVTQESTDYHTINGCRIQKMSKSRLEQICNSGDYTTMKNVEAYEISPKLKMKFNGLTEDQYAISIDDICTRISLGIWKSVSVVEATYDDLYQLSYVIFDVNI